MLGLILISWPLAAHPQPSNSVRKTPVGTCYLVRPEYVDAIRQQVQKIRSDITRERQSGRLIGYLSTPLSGKGGGNRVVNIDISNYLKRRLEGQFGLGTWILDPSAYDLPPVGNLTASGEEYGFLWANVLAGDDGLGSDFDFVFITGPTDMRSFFQLDASAKSTNLIDGLRDWMTKRAEKDPKFASDVLADPNSTKAFIKYYAFRASSEFSVGAHDEWNIFVAVNSNRRSKLGIAEQIPIFFDGRQLSAAEMETPVSNGSTTTCPPAN
jgi:hypothetical protein